WRGTGALSHEEAERFSARWRETLREAGLLAVTWPLEHGGAGLGPLEQVVLAEELVRAGVPQGSHNDVFGIQMVGSTLLRWGTEEQRRHFLPRIVSGEDRWCQGYSEPGAGSDLANVSCRAVLDGDEWVIDGQKLWTSAARSANWIFLLARTDPEAPKHRGISFLLVPMDQPGVEVRPIRMMTGGSELNEVFFSAARTAACNVVGEVHSGWAVAMTLLGFERGEAAATLPLRFRQELDRLVALVAERGLGDDPLVRQRVAWCHSRVEIMRYLGYRELTRFLAGEPPGAASSVSKLCWSEYHQVVTELAMEVLGMDGAVPQGRAPRSVFQTDETGAPGSSASWAGVFLNSRAGTIYAGTSEVQRTIIGEMVLGLPREPRADSGPWGRQAAR
ncbi:MAG: acyl-CoA dehydrogenase family protein, partial [Acidimicrobiales bacterium]